MPVLKLKKKDIVQQGDGAEPKKHRKRWVRVVLWAGGVSTVLAVVIATALYSALYGGRELFLKGCYNFRYDLFPVSINQTEPDTLVFAAVGDTAVYREELLPNITKTVAALTRVCSERGCDFAVLMGDNISDVGVKSTESPFLKKYHEVPFAGLNIPMLVIPGNHDYRTNLYAQIAYSYKNKNWMMPNNEFTIRTEFADFFGINSNCDVISYMKLARRIFNPDKWNFVLAHHALYSEGPHGDAPWHIRNYWNYFLADKTDIFIGAHNHSLEYLTLDNQTTQYVVSGITSYKSSNQVKNKSAASSEFFSDEYGFSIFTVSKESVVVDLYNADGQPVFSRTIQK